MLLLINVDEQLSFSSKFSKYIDIYMQISVLCATI